VFPHSQNSEGFEFTSFAALEGDEILLNESLYEAKTLNERYQNFLNWLFATMRVEESTFRKSIFEDLQISSDMNILITSVGNGDDIINLVDKFPNTNLNIYAQDISAAMCDFTLIRLRDLGIEIRELNISNIASLPYKSNYFDVVFHFGGINWISNKVKALAEMVRVCKNYGKIGIVDESVGTWLRKSDFGKAMIKNNSLWSAEVPLDVLPPNINKVRLEYVLENCFYFLSFIKDPQFPNVDLDVQHIGPRGGSIRTRYSGNLEGVEPGLAELVRNKARFEGVSEVEWLEKCLRNGLNA
jgi:ubiquinone/menaquinone biosynthesis C-methylase UbiE